jgi:hypothetical protein
VTEEINGVTAGRHSWARWREWIGTSMIALTGTVIGLLGIWRQWPTWLLVGFGLVTLSGVWMSRPRRPEPVSTAVPPKTETAFVRGDASGSYFGDVFADGADVFIDGNANRTVFERVLHRPAQRRKQ